MRRKPTKRLARGDRHSCGTILTEKNSTYVSRAGREPYLRCNRCHAKRQKAYDTGHQKVKRSS